MFTDRDHHRVTFLNSFRMQHTKAWIVSLVCGYLWHCFLNESHEFRNWQFCKISWLAMQKHSFCLEIIPMAMLFSDNPDWLISPCVAAGVQVSNHHIMQKKRFTTHQPSYTQSRSHSGQAPLCKHTCNRRGPAATFEIRTLERSECWLWRQQQCQLTQGMLLLLQLQPLTAMEWRLTTQQCGGWQWWLTMG